MINNRNLHFPIRIQHSTPNTQLQNRKELTHPRILVFASFEESKSVSGLDSLAAFCRNDGGIAGVERARGGARCLGIIPRSTGDARIFFLLNLILYK